MRTAAIALVAGVLAVPALAGTPVSITGDVADYHITLPEGNAAINTLQGLGTSRVGTFRETRPNPGTRQEAERRAIFQFDLSSLLPLGSTITAATFSLFVPTQNSGIANRAVDLWGSSQNRAAVVNFGDAGAANEYDAPSYSLVSSGAVPILTPPELNSRRSTDVTAFLQARYADFLANNTNRFVFFRTQVAPGGTTSFYEFNTAEAGAEFAPKLDVRVIPSPGTAVFGVATMVLAFRRRR
jgi:hypothetical protein